jgi:hypothetical protein
MPLKCDPARKIVDDSGFPRTPDRLLNLCGTHVWWLEVFNTITSTCGPYYLGGSATAITDRMLPVTSTPLWNLSGIDWTLLSGASGCPPAASGHAEKVGMTVNSAIVASGHFNSSVFGHRV